MGQREKKKKTSDPGPTDNVDKLKRGTAKSPRAQPEERACVPG